MGRIHGKNAYIEIEDTSGCMQDISGAGNLIRWLEQTTYPDVSVISDENHVRSASGLTDSSLVYEGFGDPDSLQNLTLFQELKHKPTMLMFAPGGFTAGVVNYTACMVLRDFEINAPVSGLVTVSAQFDLRSGSPTKGTLANTGIGVMEIGTTFKVS